MNPEGLLGAFKRTFEDIRTARSAENQTNKIAEASTEAVAETAKE